MQWEEQLRNHSKISLPFFFGGGDHKAENYRDMEADLVHVTKLRTALRLEKCMS